MKNFGLLKTKIEELLINSYNTNAFKTELKKFKRNVLENKDVAQLYHIYDSLSSAQGLTKEESELFLKESIDMIRSLIKNVNTKNIDAWVKGVTTENKYSDIDIVIEGNVTNISNIIECKKLITENLQKERITREVIKLPLKTMLKVANQSLNEHLSTLDSGDREILNSILNLSEEDIVNETKELKNTMILKLEKTLLEQTETDIINKLNETLDRVKEEKPTNLNLYRLRKLNEIL